MKKMLICCGVLCMTLLLFCGTALAEVKVTPGADSTVTVTPDEEGKKFTVAKQSGAADGELYLVMIQQGTDASVMPTSENLYYLNVDKASGTAFQMTAYPKDLVAGDYVVFLSDYSGDANKGTRKAVATLTVTGTDNPVNTDYTLGDVDGKEGITPADALLAAQIAAKTLNNVEDWQRSAADVDKKEGVTQTDAMLILQKAGFPDLDFSQYQK